MAFGVFAGENAGARLAGALAAELWRLADVPIEGVHFFGMNDTKLMCENMNTKSSLV